MRINYLYSVTLRLRRTIVRNKPVTGGADLAAERPSSYEGQKTAGAEYRFGLASCCEKFYLR